MKKKIGLIGVSVLVFAFILGTIAVMRLTSLGTPFFNPVGDSMNSVLYPVEGFFSRASNSVGAMARSLFDFRTVQKENEVLHEDINQLTTENALLQEKLLAAERYRVLGEAEFQTPYWDQYTKIGASVISRNQNNWYQMIKINKGRRQGVALNTSVVTNAGLVGKVVSLAENTAQVLLMTDAQAQASSFVRQEQGQAVFGVLYGTCELGSGLQSVGDLFHMDFKQEDELFVGDLVLTSGLGGVYPKGIVIGTIADIHMNSSGLMKTAYVKPMVDFDALEEVYVIITGDTQEEPLMSDE